jgi:signal transduction histidine kinase
VAARPLRSLSGPIILSSVTVALCAALLVGWIWVILRNVELSRQYVQNTWLLVVGVLSFAVIITVLLLFAVFLAREFREVRRQTSFLDSVTHELRSPLASLRLCLETLARRELDADKQRELREMMLDDVERLTGFVDDILEASRLTHGWGPQAVERVDLRGLIDVCAANVARRHRIDRGAIDVDIPHGVVVRADPLALEVVVKNLLDNAVKYSDRDACHVTVRAHLRGVDVDLEVMDRGIGIPRADLHRVFERFYRVPQEDVRARRGTGLGLYVVSALVRGLGGRLRAQSEGPGKGTTMWVRLPRQVGRAG